MQVQQLTLTIKFNIMIGLIIFLVLVAAGIGYRLKTQRDKAAKVYKASPKVRSVVKPVGKTKAPVVRADGYDSKGNPVKMKNETGPDFQARIAHHYYVVGRK